MDRKFPLSSSSDSNDVDGLSHNADDGLGTPLGRVRGQAMQRLQVGFAGILVMVLVIGLAASLTQRAQTAEDAAVPEAAPTTEPVDAEPQSDPLADAGVVPELPDETEEEAAQEPAVAPEQGSGSPAETEVDDIEVQ